MLAETPSTVYFCNNRLHSAIASGDRGGGVQRKVSFPNYFNPLSLAETPCGADWKREFHISIHSAIASRDTMATEFVRKDSYFNPLHYR